VVATIIRFAGRISSRGWLICAGLLLGGVLGNLTDRVFREPGFFLGHVIDWIQMPNWQISLSRLLLFSPLSKRCEMSLPLHRYSRNS
jgi:lipoprotein signal peptidase